MDQVVVTNNGFVLIDSTASENIIVTGLLGPAGTSAGGGGAGIFIQDIIGVGGIVGQKTWNETVPPQVHIQTATSDTSTVRVYVGADGEALNYSPTVSVNGVIATLTESSTKRWFTGYADVPLDPGTNTITAQTLGGATDTATVVLAGAGPVVLGATFGNYPGTQTELKQGDQISISITTEPEATELQIISGGASNSLVTLPVTGGLASGIITISTASGAQSVTIRAKNALGTYGTNFTSTTLTLNQTYPSISAISVGYPSGQGAFNSAQSGTLTASVSNFDTISYISSQFTIADSSTYNITKTITNTHTGYVGSGTNLTIVATRAANAATTIRTGLAYISTIAPTASISIVGNPARLISSPTGIDYEIRVTPNQLLNSAPSLNASLGTWQGAWTNTGGYWSRLLRISDSTARGNGLFSSLQVTSLSNIVGTTITSGSAYTVGGLTQRTLTFPAFSRTVFIGAQVGDQTKTSAQISGGNVLVRYTDNQVRQNGYYISNSDGTYNATGDYLALSDSAFAGANTTGTLAAIFQEVA